MKQRYGVVVGLACLAGTAAVARATTVRRMETAELVARSQLIVHGTVINTEVVFDAGPTGPSNVRTLTTISVQAVLKGEAGQTVKVAGFGGRVGDKIYHWPGVPQFEIGEETIVMLSKPVPNTESVRSLLAPLGRDDNMMVTGLAQGRLKVETDVQGAKVVTRSNDGLEFVDHKAKAANKGPRSLDDVLTEIQDVVEVQRSKAQRTEGDK